MQYDFDLVGKIGSMALIRREDADIDYNIFSRLGSELKPGMIWVTSGAAEIGRLDYIKRTGHELTCDSVDAKTDFAASLASRTVLPPVTTHVSSREAPSPSLAIMRHRAVVTSFSAAQNTA